MIDSDLPLDVTVRHAIGTGKDEAGQARRAEGRVERPRVDDVHVADREETSLVIGREGRLVDGFARVRGGAEVLVSILDPLHRHPEIPGVKAGQDVFGKDAELEPESAAHVTGDHPDVGLGDAEGVGEVLVRGNTVMRGYLDDPALTAETIVDGWLKTGDLGRLDASGHLTLFGRRKNMIVTPGGKNVYPEDIENAFEGLPVKEYCVFASHALWPVRDERLVLVVAPEAGNGFEAELRARNRRLPDFKRVSGYVVWGGEFPRTASLKIKRDELARALKAVDPGELVAL